MDRLTDEQRTLIRAYNIAKRKKLHETAFDLLIMFSLSLTQEQESYYSGMSLNRKYKDLQNTWKNLNL